MSWVEPISTAVTAILVRQGKAVVPIFGAGGVGKTTVSNLLVGADPFNIGAPYRESSAIEIKELQDFPE